VSPGNSFGYKSKRTKVILIMAEFLSHSNSHSIQNCSGWMTEIATKIKDFIRGVIEPEDLDTPRVGVSGLPVLSWYLESFPTEQMPPPP
jgi:hypothetical protein